MLRRGWRTRRLGSVNLSFPTPDDQKWRARKTKNTPQTFKSSPSNPRFLLQTLAPSPTPACTCLSPRDAHSLARTQYLAPAPLAAPSCSQSSPTNAAPASLDNDHVYKPLQCDDVIAVAVVRVRSKPHHRHTPLAPHMTLVGQSFHRHCLRFRISALPLLSLCPGLYVL